MGFEACTGDLAWSHNVRLQAAQRNGAGCMQEGERKKRARGCQPGGSPGTGATSTLDGVVALMLLDLAGAVAGTDTLCDVVMVAGEGETVAVVLAVDSNSCTGLLVGVEVRVGVGPGVGPGVTAGVGVTVGAAVTAGLVAAAGEAVGEGVGAAVGEGVGVGVAVATAVRGGGNCCCRGRSHCCSRTG